VSPAAQGVDPAPERIGILGGSFDPPHIGHVLLAQDAIEALALDRLLVIPTGTQPLKGAVAAPPLDRLSMVRAAFAGVPRVEVDAIEIERGGLSFMVDTVDTLRRRWPAAAFHLLLGADAAADLARWRDPARLLQLVQLVVADRGEPAGPDAPAPWREWPDIRPPRRLTGRRVDVSSSEVRSRVAAGLSIRGFVPDAVAAWIATSGLYLSRNAC
jgi:nicotinate-nucleotide adenylyltransferase